MRQIICDICGCTHTIGINLSYNSIGYWQSVLGPMPAKWEAIGVRKTIKKDNVLDLCPDCREKYYSVRSSAQNTMDATVNSWLDAMLHSSGKKEDI